MGRHFVPEQKEQQSTLSTTMKAAKKSRRVKGIPLNDRVWKKFEPIIQLIQVRIRNTAKLFPATMQKQVEQDLLAQWNTGVHHLIHHTKSKAKTVLEVPEMEKKNEKTKWNKLEPEIKNFLEFCFQFISHVRHELDRIGCVMKVAVVAEFIDIIFNTMYDSGSQGVKCIWTKSTLTCHETLEHIFQYFPELGPFSSIKSMAKDDNRLIFFQTISNIRANAFTNFFGDYMKLLHSNNRASSPVISHLEPIVPSCPLPPNHPMRFTPNPLAHPTSHSSIPLIPDSIKAGLPNIKLFPMHDQMSSTSDLPQNNMMMNLFNSEGNLHGNTIGMHPLSFNQQEQQEFIRQMRQCRSNPLIRWHE